MQLQGGAVTGFLEIHVMYTTIISAGLIDFYGSVYKDL